jgi:hypothetical protein
LSLYPDPMFRVFGTGRQRMLIQCK